MPPKNTEEIYNKDELDAPEFLNKELFAKVLKKCENNENLVVKNIKFTPASLKGDHYASIMFRANIEYEQEGVVHTKPMIIKTMPLLEGQKKESLQESYIFETEIGMYTEVLPKFQTLLRAVGDETVLAARVLYHSLDPYKVIIFEDLVPQGYEVVRNRPFNEEEAKAAYTKLAKWHAVSYKLALDQPEYFDQYRHSFWAIPNAFANDFFNDSVKHLLEVLHTQPSLSEYIPHFEAIQGDLLKNVTKSCNEYRENPQTDTYYVLTHGDFHGKNMMFKHNSKTGHVDDVMLLDFQISFMGPIIYDLMYSQYTLLGADLRPRFDEFLYFYFNVFTTTLKNIGFKGKLPKLIELKKQLLDNKSFDLYLLATFLPMCEAMIDGALDLQETLTYAESRRKLYNSEKFIKELHRLLPKFLHLGYFEN